MTQYGKWTALAGAIALAWAGAAAAQGQGNYPNRPLTIVVATGAGGPVDVNTRVYAKRLGEILGQPVVVQNKPGGGGVIADGFVAKAPADGYTLLAVTPTITIAPALRPEIDYHPIKSFDPVIETFYSQSMLAVRSSLQMKTAKEYMDYARANPGKLMYAAPGGIGGINNMWGAWLHGETDTKVTYVGYQGAPNAIADLVSGRVDATIASISFMRPLIEKGTMTPLAVTGKARNPVYPNVPTITEEGILPEFDAVYWVGYLAPKGTPRAAIDKLNAAFNQILASDEEKQRLASLGQAPLGGTPEDFAATLRQETDRWQRIVQKTGIKLE